MPQITFIPQSTFEEIRLGDIVIGSITGEPSGDRIGAWVRLSLPDMRQVWPATTREAARKIAQERVAEWLQKAGVRQ